MKHYVRSTSSSAPLLAAVVGGDVLALDDLTDTRGKEMLPNLPRMPGIMPRPTDGCQRTDASSGLSRRACGRTDVSERPLASPVGPLRSSQVSSPSTCGAEHLQMSMCI